MPGGTLIDCREPHGSYFPDPEDCRHFYHCSDWSGLQKKSCGSHLYFNSQTGVCDWPSVVRRMRPECPDPNALEEHESPRAHQPIVPGKAGTLTKVQFLMLLVTFSVVCRTLVKFGESKESRLSLVCSL